LERLYFGARARRRARFKRMALRLSMLSLIGIALGIPGTDMGLSLVGSIVRSRDVVVSSGTIQTSRAAESTLRFRREVFERRPKPKPPPPQQPPSSPPEDPPPNPSDAAPSITEIIYSAAARHGLSGDYLLSIAECESGLDPAAYNPTGYHGLFQFDQETWAAYGSGDIYDPAAQAEAAAALLAAGEASRWPNCA
jgi:resuscitation-promoting factor RpfB